MKGLWTNMEKLTKPPRINILNFEKKYISNLQYFTKKETFIKTFDKIIIPQIFFKNNKKTKRTIIYCHSYASNKSEGLNLLEICKKFNFNLCVFDARGCGQSSESEITFGFKEKIDLFFIVINCYFLEDCEEFVCWGRSMGCNSILQLLVFLGDSEKNSNFRESKENFEDEEFENDFFGNKNNKIEKLINIYFNENMDKLDKNFLQKDINFIITGIILDAPYTSFKRFVKDNLKKFLYFGFFFSKPVNYLLHNWIKKRINIDIDKYQNKFLIKLININTVFILSKNDEFVPIEKSLKLINNFGNFLNKKNKPQFFLHDKSHRLTRPFHLLIQSLDYLIKNKNEKNIFSIKVEKKKEQNNFLVENNRSEIKKKKTNYLENNSFQKETKNNLNYIKVEIFEKKNKKNITSFNKDPTVFEEKDLNSAFNRRKNLQKSFSLRNVQPL